MPDQDRHPSQMGTPKPAAPTSVSTAAGIASAPSSARSAAQPVIRTPDQRVRVFVSSTLQELAPERAAVKQAIAQLRLTPVMFELGARPHPPRELYRAYLEQSHIFIGLYWQRYGWTAPDMDVSGLEDEYNLSGERPKLIYIKAPAPEREAKLTTLLQRIQSDDDVSYKYFSTPEELRDLVEDDLALLLTERFEMAFQVAQQQVATAPTPAQAPAAVEKAPVREPEHPTHPNNLTLQRSPIVGRERELARARAVILRDDVGLLTFTGPAGTGKTRLALQVATTLLGEFEEGVFFVPLATITDPHLVPSTIAQTLGLREVGGHPIVDVLHNHVRDKRMLLLLDNFEQVIDAAPVVANLLTVAPGLKIMVTSRRPLRIRGEKEFPTPPLELPTLKPPLNAERLSHYEAVELFIQRARDVKPDFQVTNENAPAVAELCHRLDGLPLAIELAAARVKLLSPRAMLARLGGVLPLLIGGARDLPTRQQTMRGTIEWSYDLLDEAERTIFRRLSVFVGGCTLEAAEAVVSRQSSVVGDSGGPTTPDIDILEAMAGLADESLLRQEESESGERRFWMLQMIREFGQDKLAESDEEEAIRGRHAAYFARLAEQAEPELRRQNQVAWLDRLEAEHDNLRAALQWLLSKADSGLRIAESSGEAASQGPGTGQGKEHPQPPNPHGRAPEIRNPQSAEMALRMAASLWRFWWLRGYLAEGCERLSAALEYADKVLKDTATANGRVGEASPREMSLRAARASALYGAGYLSFLMGDTANVRARLDESLAIRKELGDKGDIATSLTGLGLISYFEGQYEQACGFFEETLAIRRELKDKWGTATSLNNLGLVSIGQGDYQNARELLQQALSICRELGEKWGIATVLNNLSLIARAQRNYAAARSLAEESLVMRRDIGNKWGIAFSLVGLAAVAFAQGHTERAARMLGATEAILDSLGARLEPAYQTEYDQTLAGLRKALAPEALAALWEEGREMQVEQAVAYALAGGPRAAVVGPGTRNE